MSTSPDTIINTIKQMLPMENKAIALHEPKFSGNEWHYVKECLDTGWVSSVGKFVDRFEHDLTKFTGAKFAIATSNGTSALHICYLLAGIQPGDEVLVPTMTFVATINALSYCNAIPHFIDSEEAYLGIDPLVLDDYLKTMGSVQQGIYVNRTTGRPVRALCVMHTLGHPVDLDAIEAICEKYHIKLIEDAAEALGSYYKGEHVGHRGLVGSLSFNGNKIITTGGGGAILTNNEELACRAKHITTTAKQPHKWGFPHDEIGYNYRLPNINAALGCAQLEQLEEFVKAKRTLAQKYQHALAKIDDVRVIKEPLYAKSNYWLNAIVLNTASAERRDELLAAFIKQGISVRPLWDLQHTLPMYSECPRMPLPVAESLYQRLIKLPSSVSLAMQTEKC